MTAKSVSLAGIGQMWGNLAAAVQDRADKIYVFLSVNSRRFLVGLMLTFMVSFVLSCFVIASVSAAILVEDDQRASELTPYEATATFGAEIFYQQLTIQAEQK